MNKPCNWLLYHVATVFTLAVTCVSSYIHWLVCWILNSIIIEIQLPSCIFNWNVHVSVPIHKTLTSQLWAETLTDQLETLDETFMHVMQWYNYQTRYTLYLLQFHWAWQRKSKLKLDKVDHFLPNVTFSNSLFSVQYCSASMHSVRYWGDNFPVHCL